MLLQNKHTPPMAVAPNDASNLLQQANSPCHTAKNNLGMAWGTEQNAQSIDSRSQSDQASAGCSTTTLTH